MDKGSFKCASLFIWKELLVKAHSAQIISWLRYFCRRVIYTVLTTTQSEVNK